jgi:hypothetical protein
VCNHILNLSEDNGRSIRIFQCNSEKVTNLLMIDFNVPEDPVDPLPKGRSSQLSRARLKVRSYPVSPASLPTAAQLGAIRGLRVMRPGLANRPSLPVVQPQILPLPDPIAEITHPVFHARPPVKGQRPYFHLNIPLDVLPKPREETFDLEHARSELQRIENRRLRQTKEVSPIWLDPAFIAPV